MPYLTRDFTAEGWLSKTGPNEQDAYRKRWFTLDDRKLMYHLAPLVIRTYYVVISFDFIIL